RWKAQVGSFLACPKYRWTTTNSLPRQSTPLVPHELGKHNGVAKIATRQPSWFACQPMEPLETHPLHPAGRTSLLAGQEVDGGPCTNGNPGADLIGVTMDPKFLLRSPESHD